jgi:hypothetical protein
MNDFHVSTVDGGELDLSALWARAGEESCAAAAAVWA